MILQIAIQNFIFIENAVLNFHPGLNIVTGETGAGKSIFLGALSVTLGEALKADLIQPGKTFLKVTSVFDISKNKELLPLLAELGVSSEDNQLSIRREIDLEGKSRCYVNDQLTRVSVLKQIGTLLIDLHGQQDNQFLFQSQKHATFYDRFLGIENSALVYRKAYAELSDLIAEGRRLAAEEESVKKEKDFLDFTIRELKDKLVSEEEYETLKNKVRSQVAKEKSNRILSQTDEALSELVPLADKVRSLFVDLSKQDELYQSGLEKMNASRELLEEVRDLVADKLGEDTGVESIDDIQDRLAKTESLKKKYGLTIEGLREKLKGAEDKLDFLENVSFERGKLEKSTAAAAQNTKTLAEKLREERKKGLPTFEKAVGGELEFLGMKGARISLGMSPLTSGPALPGSQPPVYLNESGLDQVEFVYSPTRETTLKKLKDIASGGEISRIMLSFKKVLGKSIPAHTMVFDEIDTGIGGATALNVGKKIKEIAGDRQLIVITHLPQIAKFADGHFRVLRRIEDAGRTHTRISELSGEERVAEIARMLSGSAEGTKDLLFAKEFIEKTH